MGCVSFSLRYFPGGRVDKKRMKEAELAARKELQSHRPGLPCHRLGRGGGVVGHRQGDRRPARTEWLCPKAASPRDGLDRLRAAAGAGRRCRPPEPRRACAPTAIPVLPGGVAIMSAVFKEFGIERMVFSEGALRLGVLYDLLGRYHHDDLREATVGHFMRRYEVDRRQAERVGRTAFTLLGQLLPAGRPRDADHADVQFLLWAARLHEIGVSIAHSSYHKHSAYILGNADMPGFSRRDQARLARLVLAHRGKLERVHCRQWSRMRRLAADLLPCASPRCCIAPATMGRRLPVQRPCCHAGFNCRSMAGWLAESPLTAAALQEEVRQWASVGIELQRQEPARTGGAVTDIPSQPHDHERRSASRCRCARRRPAGHAGGSLDAACDRRRRFPERAMVGRLNAVGAPSAWDCRPSRRSTAPARCCSGDIWGRRCPPTLLPVDANIADLRTHRRCGAGRSRRPRPRRRLRLVGRTSAA